MSCDQYRLPNGLIVNCTSEAIEEQIKQDGGKLWNGYDYEKQEWVYHGKKDTRTLEDLQKA
jgi:hypothetical protein